MAFTKRLLAIATASLIVAANFSGADASPVSNSPSAVIGGAGLNSRLLILLKQLSQHYGRPVQVSSG